MEILLIYRQFQILPSYSVRNCVVTPPPEIYRETLPEQQLPELDSAESIIEGLGIPITRERRCLIWTIIGSTRSGRFFEPQKIKQCVLARRYPGRSNRQFQMICNSLWNDGLILYVRNKWLRRVDVFHWVCERQRISEIMLKDVILPIESECQIHQGISQGLLWRYVSIYMAISSG